MAVAAEDVIRPWNYRSWIFPRDPHFTHKAGPILDLYDGRWQGELLHPGDFVVCCDEKPSIQARARKHTTNPKPGGDGQLSSTNTGAKERSATSPAGTSSTPGSSTAAPPRTESNHSISSSTSP